MAPMDKKRKSGPTNESFIRSKRVVGDEDRPSKRPRPEDKEKRFVTKIPVVPKLSKARDEEVAFPRGGASVLTPLEHKQIQIEATRDVLFEAGAKSSNAFAEGEEEPAAVKKKHKSKSKGRSTEVAEPEEETIKIEGLSYKRLVPGSLVLGQVSQINDHDIALALPNNLTGYIPITSVSDKLTKRIEAITSEDVDEVPEEVDDDVDLQKLFNLGQYLRAYVVSTSGDADPSGASKGKRRIELSLTPQLSNNGLSTENVIVNSTLMASVISVEDHGIILDVGLQNLDVRGFMSSRELGDGVELSDIQEGAIFFCMVTGFSSNKKTVKLTSDPQKIGSHRKLNFISDAPTVDAFLPGSAVEILVTDVTARGIAGKLMGMLDVTADLMHSGAGASVQDLEKKYKIGSKVKSRVICNFPTADPPKLGVSLLDHVMQLTSQQASKDGKKVDPLKLLPLSTIIEEVTVRKVEPGIGLFVDIGLKGVSGFVHISRVKDGKIETLSETTGPYKVESVHRGRIIGYNSLDGIYLISLEPSILEQPFLRIEDLKIGEIVKGKVEKIVINARGVGGLLVNLAEGITGLVPEAHMSDIHLKNPDKKFKGGMKVTARVLSTDPGKRQIRLTLKKTLVNSDAIPFLTYDTICAGMQSPGTIINILPNGAVVQFYGSIRGFLPVAEMSEAYIKDPTDHFRIGQVVNVHVLNVDSEHGKLSVSCRDPSIPRPTKQSRVDEAGKDLNGNSRQENAPVSSKEAKPLTFESLTKGMILPGKITKSTERQVMVQLSKTIAAPVHLPDLADDYSQADPTKHKKNDSVRVCITDIDSSKKSLRLSMRPSRVLNSSLPVEDTEITSVSQLKPNDVVRGFVKNITDKGLFINLGGGIAAYVRVADLSDSYIKDWQSEYEIDQLVKGKIMSIDPVLNKVQMSLKSSVVDKNYVAPTTFNDLKVGQIVTGKIRKVEDFGVFIVIDGSQNVSGLCHQSEMAEKRVYDVKKLYEEGDSVKAIILKLDGEKKRVSFGLKASYFEDGNESGSDVDDEDIMQGVKLANNLDREDEEDDDDEDNDDGGIDLDDVQSIESIAEPNVNGSDEEMVEAEAQEDIPALSAGGFDWTANVLDDGNDKSDVASDDDGEGKAKKKKRRKAEIKVDRTGDLDANGPQSISDFERLLLGQPDSSELWIQYMAFQMQLSELEKAREIAERAIKSINVREETEKMNVWVALLNLECAYGSDETLEEVFKRAYQHNDAQEIYERFASILIQSGKHEKADTHFQALTKKFSQSPEAWYNYAQFLHTTLSAPERAHALLPRAIQSLPPHTHIALTLKFAALEFHSPSGSPERGRTMYEGILSTFPKRLDIWNQLLDLETQQGDKDITRGVFERVVRVKGLKPKGAKALFRRWSEWEEANGDKKTQEKVKARAEEWVRSASKSGGGEE